MAVLLINILGGIISNYGIYIISIIFFWFVIVSGREINILNKNLKNINHDISKLLASSDYSANNGAIIEKISNIIESNNSNSMAIFRMQYKKFYRSLLLVSEHKKPHYFCSKDIEEYISVPQIFYVSSVYESSSAILIGLGIIFSLVCMTLGTEELGIKKISSELEIHNHIVNILNNLSSKFLSTVFGIATALFYTLFYSHIKCRLEKNIRIFCNLIHTRELLPLKNKNQLLYEIKEAIDNSIVK
jgi:hypothetical protein